MPNNRSVRTIKDFIIYKDPYFHAAFPSVIKKANGEYLLVFRRAPNRKIFKEDKNYHVDPNSYIMMMKSTDGLNWYDEPKLIYAHPFGGSQDPCLLQLRDGSILCTSYGWSLIKSESVGKLKQPVKEVYNGFVFLGGYYIKSTDGGTKWKGPLYPPNISSEVRYNALGEKLPAYNRGALFESSNGEILWVVAAEDRNEPPKKSTHLITSIDGGETWRYKSIVAKDDSISFNESSVLSTPKGDVVAFMRTKNFNGHACIARSVDEGKTFQKWKDIGFEGYPLHALKLSDNRVLLTYGYRKEPYGIRARILNEECTNYQTAPEIVIRNDGISWDLGYPWSAQLDDKHVLVVYYFNDKHNVPYIAGSILEL